MARILYYGTHGTDDPTRAALPFISANGAKEAGHEPIVGLIGDATYLIKDELRQVITPVGFPALSEIVNTTIGNGTPIHVWGGWARARGVTDQDLAGKNANFMTPADFANLVVEADRSVGYWKSGNPTSPTTDPMSRGDGQALPPPNCGRRRSKPSRCA